MKRERKKVKIDVRIDPEDKAAIEQLRQQEKREDFSDMARLVIKDGINARMKDTKQ